MKKNTAIQCAKDRIRANSVHPIVTAIAEGIRANPERYRLNLSQVPFGRYGTPEEVAYSVLDLASDESPIALDQSSS